MSPFFDGLTFLSPAASGTADQIGQQITPAPNPANPGLTSGKSKDPNLSCTRSPAWLPGAQTHPNIQGLNQTTQGQSYGGDFEAFLHHVA